jgi:hypothetical protein
MVLPTLHEDLALDAVLARVQRVRNSVVSRAQNSKRRASMTKREIKRAYLRADFGLSDAIPMLVFDHSMEQGAAFRYLLGI